MTLCCLAFVATANAAPGDLVTGFGDGGHFVGTSGPIGIDEVAALPDGRLVGLSYQQRGGYGPLVLTRFQAHGELDPSFGESGGSVETAVRRVGPSALAVRPDGRVLVAGTRYVHAGPARRGFYVEQYGVDGRADLAFGFDGRLDLAIEPDGESLLTAIELLPDGRVLLGGRSDSPTGSRLVLARVLPDGKLDPSFGRDGLATLQLGTRRYPDRPFDLMLRPDGSVLAAGASSTKPLARTRYREVEQPALVQFGPDGTLDAGFGRRGLTALTNPDDEGPLLELAERRRGGVAALQRPANRFDFAPEALVVRGFRPNGSVDRRFGHRGRARVRLPHSYRSRDWVLRSRRILAQPDGKLLVLGTAQHCYDRGGGCEERIALGRLLATGRPDPEWGRGGQGLVITRGPHFTDGLYGGYRNADPRALLLGRLGNPLVAGSTSVSPGGYLLTLYADSVAPVPDRRVPASLPVVDGRNTQLQVGCHEAGPRCTARAAITARADRRVVLLGSSVVSFAPGDTATMSIPLSRRARRLVRDRGLPVTVRLELEDATGNTFSVRRSSTIVND